MMETDGDFRSDRTRRANVAHKQLSVLLRTCARAALARPTQSHLIITLLILQRLRSYSETARNITGADPELVPQRRRARDPEPHFDLGRCV